MVKPRATMKATIEVPVTIAFTDHPGTAATRMSPPEDPEVEIDEVVFEETGEPIPESLFDAMEEDIYRAARHEANRQASLDR